MILKILMGVWFGFNIVHTITNIVKSLLLWKKETIAIILSKDEDNKFKKINPNHLDFNHKDCKYNVPKESKFFIKIKRKKYVTYNEGNPDALNPYKNEIKFDAKTYKSVTENHALRLLNTTSALAGLDMKKVLIIGGIALVGLYMFFGGG